MDDKIRKYTTWAWDRSVYLHCKLSLPELKKSLRLLQSEVDKMEGIVTKYEKLNNSRED